MKSCKKGKVSFTYNKVTQQKKFHLLNLVLAEKMLIKDAAKIVDINYSTAKTILFFYRNGEKSYQFEFQDIRKPERAPIRLRSEILDLSIKHEEGTSCLLHHTIDIVSTTGSLNERLKKIDQSKKPLNSISNHFSISQLKKFTDSSLDGKQGVIEGLQPSACMGGHVMTRSRRVAHLTKTMVQPASSQSSQEKYDPQF